MDNFNNTKTMDALSEKSLQSVYDELEKKGNGNERISFAFTPSRILVHPSWLKDKDFVAFLNDELGIEI